MRRALLILRPPTHDDRVSITAHCSDEGDIRPRLRVEAPVGGRHRKTPQKRRQPRSSKLSDVRRGNMHSAIERKAVEGRQPLDARNRPPTIEQ